MNTIKILFVGALLLLAAYAHADVKPASPFGNHMVLQREKPVPVWGTASPGESVTVAFNKQKKSAMADQAGNWRVNLDKLAAGGPYSLTVTGKNTVTFNDVYVGEVWLCSGQSNMDMTVAKEDRYWCGVFNEAEEVANANYPLIRVIDADFTPSIPILKNIKTPGWEIVSPKTVGHMSAAAYFFARDVQKKLGVPIGMVVTSYGASTAEAWMSKPALEANPKFAKLLTSFNEKIKNFADTAVQNKTQRDMDKWRNDAAKARAEGKEAPKRPAAVQNPEKDQHNPYVLWNGMVAPLVPYAIRGALWYQGESNSPTASIYRDLMEALITDWRKQWGQGDFPFIYVQLANIQKAAVGKTAFDPDPAHGGDEAIKREAQLQNLSVPKTAMVVAIDNADPEDMVNVHPKNKQEIGRRLALAGLAIAYGQKVAYSGPVYQKMQVKGSTVRILFKHTEGGLIAKGNKLVGFAIAGEDKKFVWANARIEGNTVIVSSPDVAKPVAVRYGWGNNPPTSLYSAAQNLPASPFRTDNF